MDLLPGVRSQTVATDRLRVHYLESGPADGDAGRPVHGNLSTGRFYEHLLPGAPERCGSSRRTCAASAIPSASRSTPRAACATGPTTPHALLRALGIDRPVHLAGWSTGGAAIAAFAIDRPVASLTFIDPVVALWVRRRQARDGTPCYAGLRRLGRRHRQPGLHRSGSPPATARPIAVLAAQRDEHVVLVADASRAARARGSARSTRSSSRSPATTATRATWSPPSNWPGSLPARAESSTPSRGSTATGRASSTSTPSRRSCGRTAPRTSSSPTARPGRWARSASSAPSRAGPARRCSRRSRWSTQIRDGARALPGGAAAASTIEMFEGSGHFPAMDARERWAPPVLRVPRVGPDRGRVRGPRARRARSWDGEMARSDAVPRDIGPERHGRERLVPAG